MTEPMTTFVTTTSFGSWLPGDARGYVRDGKTLPPSPMLDRHIRSTVVPKSVLFSDHEQDSLASALVDACNEFQYCLCDLAVEAWHVHWIVRHEDGVATMVGRLKNRTRQRLDRGRIWTAGYWSSFLLTDHELWTARDYIRRHDGCRIIDGDAVNRT